MVFRRFLSPKAAKMRESAPIGMKIRAILNEILASTMEIKCSNRARQGKEIALLMRPAADSSMM
ncbi:hypothetical protein ACM42_29840 [Bradyrhizobium sp. CCBAU 25338]|nr:hypothetical protein [Bradyrhizobium sp. CCBAU 25338]